MLLMQTYAEVDLNEMPCIFAQCGHFFTGETLDGQMAMHEYYNMSADDAPESVKAPSEPFSVDSVKVCPNCRGSLRNISRYGRIVRRGLLDESTKKFIVWSTQCLTELGTALLREQDNVRGLKDMGWELPESSKITLSGSADEFIQTIRKSPARDLLKGVLTIRGKIHRQLGRVKKEEQPFQRVADLVRHARKHHGIGGHFAYDQSVIQMKGYIQTLSLLLRCDISLVAELLDLGAGGLFARKMECQFDLSHSLDEAVRLIDLAEETKRPYEEVEGHLYYAQSCVLERCALQKSSEPATSAISDKSELLRINGASHLARACSTIDKCPSTSALRPEIEAVEKMLRDSTFYASVSGEERRAVYEAMSREFRGTGHWYTCRNGHPFTIGECGGAMEQARCPDCGEAVGGRSHQLAEGVQRATDMEALGEGVRGMRM